MLDMTGGEQTFALATTGAVPPWKVKSGRSTCGNTKIRANKNSSNTSRVQRQHFILEGNLSHAAQAVNQSSACGHEESRVTLRIT